MSTCSCRNDFPLFLIIVDGKKKFVPLKEAGILFDSGWQQVDTGGLMLEKDFSVRPMTKEEERAVSNTADDYSASK